MNRRAIMIALLSVSLLAVAAGIAMWRGIIDGRMSRSEQGAAVPSVEGVTRQDFGAWSLKCNEASQDGGRCTLDLQVIDRTNNVLALLLVVMRGQEGVPILVVDTPPGVAVPSGVSVTPGDASAVTAGFQTCGAQRCRAVFALDDALRLALAAAEVTNVAFVRANGVPARYNLPMTGFSDGLTAWQADSLAP